MSGCCPNPEHIQRRTLWLILIINALAFGVQFVAAWLAQSTSLFADSLDMLGDVMAYGITLYAIGRSHDWLKRAAYIKAATITLFAVVVFSDALRKVIMVELMPDATFMIVFSIFGLLANGLCFYLLTRHRDQNINMYSVWICSGNDIIGNVSVLITAILVVYYNSRWPDLITGVLFSCVLFYSSWIIIKRARKSVETRE